MSFLTYTFVCEMTFTQRNIEGKAGSLNVFSPHNLIGSGTVWRCGLQKWLQSYRRKCLTWGLDVPFGLLCSVYCPECQLTSCFLQDIRFSSFLALCLPACLHVPHHYEKSPKPWHWKQASSNKNFLYKCFCDHGSLHSNKFPS